MSVEVNLLEKDIQHKKIAVKYYPAKIAFEYYIKPFNSDYLLEIDLEDKISSLESALKIADLLYKTYPDVLYKSIISEKQIINLINKIIANRKSMKHHANKSDNITDVSKNSNENNNSGTIKTNFNHNPVLVNSMEVFPRHNSTLSNSSQNYSNIDNNNNNNNNNNNIEKDNEICSKSNQNFFNNKDSNKEIAIKEEFNSIKFKEELKHLNNNEKSRYNVNKDEDEVKYNDNKKNKLMCSLDNFISIKEDHDLSNDEKRNSFNSRANKYKDDNN